MNANLILAEPIYISLQLAGYEEDAHKLVNHTLTPMSQENGRSLFHNLKKLAKNDEKIAKALDNIPAEIKSIFYDPKLYIGKAAAKALEVAEWSRQQIS